MRPKLWAIVSRSTGRTCFTSTGICVYLYRETARSVLREWAKADPRLRMLYAVARYERTA